MGGLKAAAGHAAAGLFALAVCGSPAQSADETLMLFSGTDVWAHGAFLHGGAVWAPAGLNRDGLLFKALISGGSYTYFSGAIGTEILGRELVAQFMPGYRFKIANTEIKLFGGLDLQWHRLSPDDPSSGLRGQQTGFRVGFELWSEPWPNIMIAANGSISSLENSYDARLAAGWRPQTIFGFYIGPEVQTFASGDYEQYRFGVHVTSFKPDWFDAEFSAAVGWARDSDDHSGTYARISALTRY
jgi:hypothetical protein